MISRKTALAMIVISLTFSIGFVTFKAAELVKSLVMSKANCSHHNTGASCDAQRDGVSGLEIPLR